MPTLLVNSEAIEEAALRRETAAMLALLSERMPEEDPLALRIRANEWAEENLIEALLLRQAALADPETQSSLQPGEPQEPDVERRVQRLVSRVTAQAAPPRDQDIKAFYEQNRDNFREPEQLRVAHIVRHVDELHGEESARAAIERARDELAAGRPFGEVADALSDCPGQGGELDAFSRGEMVPAFEEVVFQLAVNQVSGIFRTEFGFHIAMLLARRPARVRALAEVEEQIRSQLLATRQQQHLDQYLDGLRARAVIHRSANPVED